MSSDQDQDIDQAGPRDKSDKVHVDTDNVTLACNTSLKLEQYSKLIIVFKKSSRTVQVLDLKDHASIHLCKMRCSIDLVRSSWLVQCVVT